jgi:hypothetical protein
MQIGPITIVDRYGRHIRMIWQGSMPSTRGKDKMRLVGWSSWVTRVLAVAALVAVGLGLGLNLHQGPVAAHATYPEYRTVTALASASDLVVRGLVQGPGVPFLDYGADDDAVRSDKASAVPMRLFNVEILGPSQSSVPGGSVIQVAVTDSIEGGISGDAELRNGDDVFLFLESLNGTRLDPGLVVGESFYVVVGGHQGTFRQSSDDTWEQEHDPYLLQTFDTQEGSPAQSMRVQLGELENAEARG